MDLYTHTFQNVPNGWEELFNSSTAEIKQISDILELEKSKGFRIVPNQEDTFKIFHLAKPSDVSVIILGMDPYPQILANGQPRAKGFSFSVDKDDAIPSSLQNIYKEIINNYPQSIYPKNGDISHWVPQGVFLLNSSLTCRVGEPNSHGGKYRVWAPFISRFVKYMSNINKSLIWVLWGKEAQKIEEMIDKIYVNILRANHPSGLSASRGFFGCGHFRLINEKLKAQGRPIIKWMEQDITDEYIEKLVGIMSENDLTTLIDFYKGRNDFQIEEKKFSIHSYLSDIYKMMIEKKLIFVSISQFFKMYFDLYEKHRNIGLVASDLMTEKKV